MQSPTSQAKRKIIRKCKNPNNTIEEVKEVEKSNNLNVFIKDIMDENKPECSNRELKK